MLSSRFITSFRYHSPLPLIQHTLSSQLSLSPSPPSRKLYPIIPLYFLHQSFPVTIHFLYVSSFLSNTDTRQKALAITFSFFLHHGVQCIQLQDTTPDLVAQDVCMITTARAPPPSSPHHLRTSQKHRPTRLARNSRTMYDHSPH